MAKIKGVDYENGEMTAVYVENADGVHRFVAERHGRWIGWFDRMRSCMTIASREYECSVCMGESDRIYDYCPNCGSRMDGDSHDNG